MKFIEVMTGRMRPRHRRFQEAFSKLCNDLGLEYSLCPLSISRRLSMLASMRCRGVRCVNYDKEGSVALLHQALNCGSMQYIAEFDVPLGLYGYNLSRYRQKYNEARRLMERPQLRAILTFSNWARRSFALHFGQEIEAKCRVVYPLACFSAKPASYHECRYDFAFVSTRFRIKGGPEAVRAFQSVCYGKNSDSRFCVITNLTEAEKYLGKLGRYKGIDWYDAKLGDDEIADILTKTRCLVHPSLSDSFGVVVLEALAAGCAVITTKFASFEEMVGQDNGWLLAAPTATVVGDTYITEYGNADYHEGFLNTLSLHRFEAEIASCMSEFLNDTERSKQMMDASYKRYREHFSLGAWQQNMRNILFECFPELQS